MPTVSFTTSGALRKAALRHANERLVLDSIRRSPGISRAEIARRTGSPRTSVTFVVDRLLKARLICEEKGDRIATSAGRPPTALHLRAAARLAVGVEIARPLTRVVLVDLQGNILERRTIHWHEHAGHLLEDVHQAIRAVASPVARRQLLGAGVSLPGTIDRTTGRVIGAESLGWFNVDAGHILRQKIDLPLWFENDANLCALAEQWHEPGDASSLRYFVYVRAQGGLGTGVVIDGRTLHGFASAGSEFGHVMLFADGRPCPCGNRGCWEQYASDAALVRCYRELRNETVQEEDILASSRAIVERAMQGEECSREALRVTAEYLALGFANLVAAFNPQAIVVGEPFAQAWDLMKDTVYAEMRQRVPAYCMDTLRLLPSRLGPDAALHGAAALVLRHFFTQFDSTRVESPAKGVSIYAHA
jgi:predicted NBD/HSP70 family sugar kinase